MSYRAFWQRRCRAAAAGAVLKPQGGNCAVLPLNKSRAAPRFLKDAVPFCMQSSLKILQNINLCEITTKRIEDENRKKRRNMLEFYTGLQSKTWGKARCSVCEIKRILGESGAGNQKRGETCVNSNNLQGELPFYNTTGIVIPCVKMQHCTLRKGRVAILHRVLVILSGGVEGRH